MSNVIVKNCKLVAPAAAIAAGKVFTPVTYAKTATLYKHRDEVWALQAKATSAFMDALSAVEGADAERLAQAAAGKVAPK